MNFTHRLIFVIFCSFPFVLFGQNGGGQRTMPKAQLSGVIVDASTDQPVEYATVVLKHLKDSTFIAGTVTNPEGKFVVENLRPGRYLFSMSFIGYETFRDTIALRPPDALVLDRGKLQLKPSVTSLDEVTIKGERETMQFGIDRKVFNVDKNAMSQGGSLTDVLRQVPSVNVDIDGSVSMRGSSNLIVLINGKPSGITGANRQAVLDQIPASSIERIELITNPSAKYDPDGMSGIINVITKRDLVGGWNGRAAAGIGTNGKYNASFALSYKQGKWGISTDYGYRYADFYGNGTNLRDNFLANQTPFSINQYSSGNRLRISNVLSTNVDYAISDKSSISLNALIGVNNGDAPETVLYQFLDDTKNLTRLSNRATSSTNNGYNTDWGLNYRKQFAKPQQELLISSNFSLSQSKNLSSYNQQEMNVLNNQPQNIPPLLQRNDVGEIFNVWATQADYTHPITKGKIEAGTKTTIRRLDTDFYADSLDNAKGVYVDDNRLINHFKYSENVYAAYATLSQSFGKISYQAGLRAENTNIVAQQLTTNVENTNDFIYFFPSLHLSRKLGDKNEIQLSYGRRINRPNFNALNPFADYSDPLNIRIGNPKLLPETIESVEAGYISNFDQHTLTSSVYFRQINNTMQRVRRIQEDGVSVVSFENLDYARNYGFEFILKSQWYEWWNSTANLNLFRNQVFGSTQDGELNTSNYSYSIRLMSGIKIGNKQNIELNYNYNAPTVIPQGEFKGFQGLDVAYRYELNKKSALTLNVTDVFDTREFNINMAGVDFRSDVRRKRESRVATITFTYRFGKPSEGKSNNRRRQNEESGGGEAGGGL